MPGAQEIRADVFPTPEQIARRFFLRGGNVNRGQCAGSIQHSQVSGIAAICLDAVPWTTRNERGGNHVARNLAGRERPSKLEAAGAGFLATPHRPLAANSLDESQNGRTLRRQGVEHRRPMVRS